MIGSTYNYTYIIFVCENAAKTLWYYPKPQFISDMGFPFYVKPLKLKTDVGSLKFIRNVPSVITEGNKFGSSLTPIIQVLNATNGPIAGKLVFALICNFNGRDYPKRYVNVRRGYKSKRLLNPFPGNYSSDSNNPLSPTDPVIPILTDSKGYAFFNESYFSQYGPYGIYKIEFICDGISVVSNATSVDFIFYYNSYYFRNFRFTLQ